MSALCRLPTICNLAFYQNRSRLVSCGSCWEHIKRIYRIVDNKRFHLYLVLQYVDAGLSWAWLLCREIRSRVLSWESDGDVNLHTARLIGAIPRHPVIYITTKGHERGRESLELEVRRSANVVWPTRRSPTSVPWISNTYIYRSGPGGGPSPAALRPPTPDHHNPLGNINTKFQ